MHRFHATLSHLHLKFERNVIFILLFIFFIAGFFTSEYLVKQDLNELRSKNTTCQSLLAQSNRQSSCLSAEELTLYSAKDKALAAIPPSPVSFSSRVTPLSPVRKEIVVSLQGNSAMRFDAADFALSFPSTVNIISVLPGEAFPSYPRNVIVKNTVLVSGVATLENNSVVLGKPAPFVTIIVEKLGPAAQDEELIVDVKNTKLFFQGKSILDEARSITKISL